MNGQLIVIVKIHARWALENYHNRDTMGFTKDLQPVIWKFLLMTSIIGDNRLACSFKYTTSFLE